MSESEHCTFDVHKHGLHVVVDMSIQALHSKRNHLNSEQWAGCVGQGQHADSLLLWRPSKSARWSRYTLIGRLNHRATPAARSVSSPALWSVASAHVSPVPPSVCPAQNYRPVVALAATLSLAHPFFDGLDKRGCAAHRPA